MLKSFVLVWDEPGNGVIVVREVVDNLWRNPSGSTVFFGSIRRTIASSYLSI